MHSSFRRRLRLLPFVLCFGACVTIPPGNDSMDGSIVRDAASNSDTGNDAGANTDSANDAGNTDSNDASSHQPDADTCNHNNQREEDEECDGTDVPVCESAGVNIGFNTCTDCRLNTDQCKPRSVLYDGDINNQPEGYCDIFSGGYDRCNAGRDREGCSDEGRITCFARIQECGAFVHDYYDSSAFCVFSVADVPCMVRLRREATGIEMSHRCANSPAWEPVNDRIVNAARANCGESFTVASECAAQL